MKQEIFKELRIILSQHKEKVIERKQEITPNFNLLSLVSLKELQLSKIIAEFLDPKGSHEQGNLFLNQFLNQFFGKIEVPQKNISVHTELAKDIDGQIDIVIDFDNKFGIAIENKPFADDQDFQIVRYINYLKCKYSDNYLMIYLSELGQNPSEKSLPKHEKQQLKNHFFVLSYEDIKIWLKKSSVKVKAKRLKLLISEIVEYINLTFLKINTLKNNISNQAIENNILEIFEIKKIWDTDKHELEKIWCLKINNLFNKILPNLVFNELKNRNIINEDWQFIEGNFDINNKTARGFSIKKKQWKNFSYGILRNEVVKDLTKGSCYIFPAILSKKLHKEINFSNPNYIQDYSLATKTEPHYTHWSKPSTIWYTDFSDEFNLWGYQQWSEIKENGKTVIYIVDFLERLIKVSEKDIDKTENELN